MTAVDVIGWECGLADSLVPTVEGLPWTDQSIESIAKATVKAVLPARLWREKSKGEKKEKHAQTRCHDAGTAVGPTR